MLVNLSLFDDTAATEIGKNVAMQIAAMNPSYLDEASVPAEVLDKEKEILIAQMKEDPKMANKPEAIIAKMVDGRMRKFYEEVVLLSQAFVINPDLSVEAALKEAEKSIGAPAKVTGFVRFALGDGIEKEETDFAAEVAAVSKG
mgnify:CR=1 FL=1